jgi:hypothetical protein
MKYLDIDIDINEVAALIAEACMNRTRGSMTADETLARIHRADPEIAVGFVRAAVAVLCHIDKLIAEACLENTKNEVVM